MIAAIGISLLWVAATLALFARCINGGIFGLSWAKVTIAWKATLSLGLLMLAASLATLAERHMP